MIKIEACPFCGLYGKAKSRYSDNSMSMFWFVQCIGCKAKTGNYDTKEQAVRAWNGRANNGKETVQAGAENALRRPATVGNLVADLRQVSSEGEKCRP